MQHPWLKDFPWDELLAKQLDAPFLPSSEDNFDARVNSEWKDEIDESLAHEAMQDLFSGYHYEPPTPSKGLFEKVARHYANKL